MIICCAWVKKAMEIDRSVSMNGQEEYEEERKCTKLSKRHNGHEGGRERERKRDWRERQREKERERK